MKKTDEIFAKTIENVLTENSFENLKIQSVVDRSLRHGYNKGWVKGYFSGLFVTGSLLAIAWVWRSVGRLEGSEKGKKEAAFWRKLYGFKEDAYDRIVDAYDRMVREYSNSDEDDIDGLNVPSRFGDNCCKSSDKKSDSDEDNEDEEDEC